MAVAIAGASRSYTAVNTQIASASARWETQAPFSTKASAAATCLASSRVTSRTSTFVSTARTPPFHVPPHSRFHLLDGSRLWRSLREQCAMDILGRIAPCTAHEDSLALLVPLQNRARTEAELAPDRCRHGNLALCRDFRTSDRHGGALPR